MQNRTAGGRAGSPASAAVAVAGVLAGGSWDRQMASSECSDTVGNCGETQQQHTRLPHRLPAPVLSPWQCPHFSAACS